MNQHTCLSWLRLGPVSAIVALALLAESAGSAHAVLLETRLVNTASNTTEDEQTSTAADPAVISGQVQISSGTISYEGVADHGELSIYAEHLKANSLCVGVTRRHIAVMTFDDVVFELADSATVPVSLNLFFDGMASFTGTNGIGSAQLDVTVEIDGQSAFIGRWIPASSLSSDISSGIFAGLSTDALSGTFSSPEFTVPTGTPVSVRVQVTVDAGAGGCNRPGGDVTMVDFRSNGRRIGFPTDEVAFNVPEGASVTSDEARLVDGVWSPAPPNVAAVCDAGGDYSGTAEEPIQFDASGSYDPDGSIEAFAWDFGDGGTSDAMDPTHAYAAAGTYVATICVTDDAGATTCCETEVEVAEAAGADLAFDIRPASCPNPLNPGSKGVIPAALLGGPAFDVNAIDVSSLRLEGVAPERSGIEDVAGAGSGEEACDCSDAESDGWDDLTLKFRTQDLVAALDPALLVRDADVPLTITGMLLDGTLFEASDCMRVVKDAADSGDGTKAGRGRKFRITAPGPNPFKTSTEIGLALDEESRVRVVVYDASGRAVKHLTDGPRPAGNFTVRWNSEGLASGVYFFRVQVGAEFETHKVILAR